MNRAPLAIVPLLLAGFVGAATVGGKIAPDGKTELHCDLPGFLHRHNVSSRGQGCCTHTSMHHSSTFQNVPALWEFPKWVQSKGLPGGTYPKLMEDRIALIAKERGLPLPPYISLEGGKETFPLLKAACQSGRMPGVTYSFSPTGRYGGSKINHMVNLVHMDDTYAVILDNNYEGQDKYEWLSIDEFTRTFTGGRSGWAVILLEPGPPPFPWN